MATIIDIEYVQNTGMVNVKYQQFDPNTGKETEPLVQTYDPALLKVERESLQDKIKQIDEITPVVEKAKAEAEATQKEDEGKRAKSDEKENERVSKLAADNKSGQ